MDVRGSWVVVLLCSVCDGLLRHLNAIHFYYTLRILIVLCVLLLHFVSRVFQFQFSFTLHMYISFFFFFVCLFGECTFYTRAPADFVFRSSAFR